MAKPTTSAAPTAPQKARRAARTGAGRFERNKCQKCGKGAPMDYFSDERSNDHGGFGVVLCERCAVKLAKLSDEEFAAEAALHG